ncbi:Lipoprotein-anchoring transpeptidase ErfK/SrfK [Mycolicibacterium rutilum]|uniref:Lipoprotein-anchoring transpeptidase ErfK/SrfK n=1 Tax=Mycolicibacterium rutilum TaxID=370526 RepID=A0A1H6LEY4_MYCRU|nr:Lipoprotein-anchoring transpeptidase ErfK/SrfK [Mycolicibacterium rutilum]
MVIATSVVAGPAEESAAAAVSSLRTGIASIAPAQGEVVGVAHPIIVTFGVPVPDRGLAERSLDITSLPAMSGRYEWLDNQTVQWVPDRFWPAHSTIALSVGGVKTNIATGPAVVGVANITDHTFTVTIDGVDAGPPPILPAPHHRPHFGKPGVFPASMGRPEYPTPVGTYSVLAKERDVLMDSSSVGIPVSADDGYLMDVEWAVRITNRGIFVHSAPWAVNALGHENVSHGCISLSPEDAEWYFNTVKVGDPVIVQENSVEIPRPREEPVNPEVPRVISR